jgi:hypothetical protein
MWMTKFCVVDLQRVCGPYLDGGKLPCPATGCHGKLESKGPRFDRIGQVHGVGTWEDYVLPFQPTQGRAEPLGNHTHTS